MSVLGPSQPRLRRDIIVGSDLPWNRGHRRPAPTGRRRALHPQHEPVAAPIDPRAHVAANPLIARHMRLGWGALLLFVTMGITLEMLHAYKAGFYLDVDRETRRLMWTLCHAHGVGLSLVNLLYAATLHAVLRESSRALQLASVLCGWSTVLVPLGFFLGGLVTYGGDPGVGVFLVPAGALMLWVAVLIIARAVWKALDSGG